MTFAPIEVPPGVVKMESDYGASGRWIDMDHVRFNGGKPEKIGGTQKLFNNTFAGIARAAQGWSSYTGVQCLVWGTACSLYLYREGALTNITPYRLDSTSIALNNPFTSTANPSIITNGDFAVDANWAKGTNMTIAAGVATLTASPNGALLQQNGLTFVAGRSYRITFTISGYAAGSVRPLLVNGVTQVGTLRSANGTFVEYLVADAGNTAFAIQVSPINATMNIDNVLVEEVTAVVSVNDVAHGITAAGVIVNFSGFAAGAGITISGDYTVTAITDANNYTITHSVAATSIVAGFGGAGTAKYTLNCGSVSSSYLVGWGVGTWGTGSGWGTSASLSSALITEPTNWSFDVYGEDLVVNQLNNGIWIYDTSTGATRPNVLTNAPAQVRSVCVTAERYIFALGCTTIAGPFDPMTVRWADILDNTIWTPSSTVTANERKLQGGTRLMAGSALGPGVTIVWSDSSPFIFQFTGAATGGGQPIYASRKIADNCGLAAQHAWAKAGGNAYWMSDTNFWMYSGYAQPIPNSNDIKDWVFENLNQAHDMKSFAFYNQNFNEIWFVFPGLGSDEPSLYVAVQLDDYSWIHGTWDRSAVATFTTNEHRPVMFGTNGVVYLHEVAGNTTNDGAALPFSLELAPTDVQAGNISIDIFGFIPDFQRQSGDLSLYLYGLDHPRDAIAMSETLTIAPTDKFVDARCAGRQFGLILSGSSADCDFRMGKWGIDIEPGGDKRGSRAP